MVSTFRPNLIMVTQNKQIKKKIDILATLIMKKYQNLIRETIFHSCSHWKLNLNMKIYDNFVE